MKKKYIICITVCLVLLSIPILYFSCYYGAIPEYAQELSVFLPKYAANVYVNESNFTDGVSFRMFKLSKNEQDEIQKEIETSEVWHLYTEDDDRLYDFIPDSSEVYDRFMSIDKNTSYIAIYDFKNDKFIDFKNETSDTSVLPLDWNYKVMIYDYSSNLYYFIELIL